jgi:hypothetical protein
VARQTHTTHPHQDLSIVVKSFDIKLARAISQRTALAQIKVTALEFERCDSSIDRFPHQKTYNPTFNPISKFWIL